MRLIYKIVNKINGKIYIGQTKLTLERRFKKHIADAFGTRNRRYAIHLALRKYGLDNFTITLLSRCNTLEEANHREEYSIRIFNTLSPNGYNLRKGGNNSSPSEETLKKMSESTKKTMTPERLRSMSEIGKELHFKNPQLAIQHSDRMNKMFKERPHLKEEISVKNGGKPFKAFKKDTMELVWEGINKKECARILGLETSAIRKCLNLEICYTEGYILRYLGEENITVAPKGFSRRKKVQNFETGEIFASAHEAAHKYGDESKYFRVNNAIKRGTSAFGYHWTRPGEKNKNNFSKIKINKRRIINLGTGIIYDSVKDAEISVGVFAGGNIHRSIKKGQKAYGYRWRFI